MLWHVLLSALPQLGHFDESRQKVQHHFRFKTVDIASTQQFVNAFAQSGPTGLVHQHREGVGSARRRIWRLSKQQTRLDLKETTIETKGVNGV